MVKKKTKKRTKKKPKRTKKRRLGLKDLANRLRFKRGLGRKTKKKQKPKPKKRPKPKPKKKPKRRVKLKMRFPKLKLPELKRKIPKKKIKPKPKAKKGKLEKKIPKQMMKKLIVADVMSRDPAIVNDTDRLSYIVRLFSSKRISGAPVVSDNSLVGLITKSDIIKVIGVKDLLKIDSSGLKRLEDFKASDIMKKNVPTVRRYTKIGEATKLMNKHDLNLLPVVDDNKRVIGIVSRGDIVRVVSKELLSKMERVERRTIRKSSKIETDIDALLEIVEREGSIDVGKIRERLLVPEERIEEWAKILEKDGLIEMFYPAFGAPVLRKKIKGEKERDNEER